MYNGLTINGVPEADYLKRTVEKMNKKDPGTGDEQLAYWGRQKWNVPEVFVGSFNDYLRKYQFEGENVEDNQKYECVIRLISIKTGINNFITPTLWVSYTFYEIGKRDKPLAFLKSHVAYAKGSSHTSSRGITTYQPNGNWDDTSSAYRKEGKKIAEKVKKGAKLKKV